MGSGREDRLQVRRIELLGLGIGLGLGAALTPAVLHGDPARLLTTFLGLVSASILPTVSLILGSMTTGGRSVAAINRLERELALAMDALFLLLGSVGLIFGAVFLLGVPPPAFLDAVPRLTDQIMPRLGQGVIVAGTVLILMRAGQIPAILRRSLAIRHEIAADEARKKTLENVAKLPDAKALFGRDPEFGSSVRLTDLQRPSP